MSIDHASALREPSTPAERFISSLSNFGERGYIEVSKAAGPGADVVILLKVHVDIHSGSSESIAMTLPTYVLVIQAEAPLPTGGIHLARIDSWTGFADAPEAPLWVKGVRTQPYCPLQFTQTLGCLYATVSTIVSEPERCPGDVWWRFLRFIKNVQEAYRTTPRLLGNERPRPSPRPRRRLKVDAGGSTGVLVKVKMPDEAEPRIEC